MHSIENRRMLFFKGGNAWCLVRFFAPLGEGKRFTDVGRGYACTYVHHQQSLLREQKQDALRRCCTSQYKTGPTFPPSLFSTKNCGLARTPRNWKPPPPNLLSPLLHPPSASVGKQEEEDEVGITSPGNPEKQSHLAHTCKKTQRNCCKVPPPPFKETKLASFYGGSFFNAYVPPERWGGEGEKEEEAKRCPF